MIIKELSRIGTEDLPIQTLKDHLRLGTGFAEDDLQDGLLELYLRTSIATIEGKTGVIVLPRHFRIDLNTWTSGDCHEIPIRPVNQIDSIIHVGVDGVETDLGLEKFSLVNDTYRPQLRSRATALPNIARNESVTLILAAGYGPDWEDIPSDLYHAVLMLAAHFYENRSGTYDADTLYPAAVMALMDRHRATKIGLGG